MTHTSTTQQTRSNGGPGPLHWPVVAVLLLLVACTPQPAPGDALTAEQHTATPLSPTATPTSPSLPPTPTAAPDAIRSLTLCGASEPASLVAASDTSYTAQLVRAAIFEGPFDILNYQLHPTLLEKAPSLADGDAVIVPAPVRAGDRVLDGAGTPARLAAGVTVRPAGCRAASCAVTVCEQDLADGAPPIVMDQMTVTFRLRDAGWTWADGTPLTAGDSVRAFEARDDSAELVELRQGTARYMAASDLEIVWVGLPGYLPAAYAQAFWTPRAPDEDSPAGASHAESQDARLSLGYGPYTPVAWDIGQAIRLHRNAHYMAPDGATPVFDDVWLRFWRGSGGAPRTEALNALAAGTCDLVTQDLHLEPALPRIEAMANAGTARLIVQPVDAWEQLTFNLNATPPLFADARTRQAVAYCLDREALAAEVTHGYGHVLDTYLPPEHPLAEAVNTYAYIPDRGATLLSQAGWLDNDSDGVREAVAVAGIEDGTPLRVRYLTTAALLPDDGGTSPDRERVAQQVTEMLAVCGIAVEVTALPPWEFYAQNERSPLVTGDFDLAQFAWATEMIPSCDLYLSSAIPAAPPVHEAKATPETPHAVTDTTVIDSPVIRYGWTGTNVGGFSDLAYDTACNRALWALPGEPDYEPAHRQAQRVFAELLPALPLYQDVTFLAARPDLSGIVPDPVSVITWNIERFE